MRCRACEVLGGLAIDSEGTRATVLQAIRDGKLAKVDPASVRVGQRIALKPCVPEEPVLRMCRERDGRPCPRVELDPDNYAAHQILRAQFREDTRGLAPALADALLAGLEPEERAEVLRRVVTTMADKAVQDAMRPPAAEA